MSLINEALLKARAQAAQRAELDQLPDALIDRAAPYVPGVERKRSVALTAMLSVGAILLAGTLLVGIKSIVGTTATAHGAVGEKRSARSEEIAVVAESLPIETVAPTPVVVEPIPEPAPDPQKQEVEVAAVTEPLPPSEPQIAEPVAPPLEPEPVAPPEPVVETVQVLASAPPPDPVAYLRSLEGKTFVKTVDVPANADGQETAHLQLDGIVWSADSPVALVNSTMVRPGDDLLGVQVARIERKLVELDARGVRFFLRMP